MVACLWGPGRVSPGLPFSIDSLVALLEQSSPRIDCAGRPRATLVAIFYTVEDWRGKRAWENCKRAAEAEGMVLDWNKFLPPSVPDDQNFYTASSNILLRFKLHQSDDADYQMAVANPWLRLDPASTNGVLLFPSVSGPIVVANIIISTQATGLKSGSNTVAVAFNDPAAPARVRQFIQSTMGQTISGAMGFEFSQFQLTNLPPTSIFMQADTLPSIADLESFLPSDTIGEHGRLQVVPTVNPQIFQVQLTKNVRITAAADYLKWSDQFVPAFDEIREALKRPDAILPGDYSESYSIPIPNFVTMRALAQTLAQRAQCYFLLDEPDKAAHELMLVHDVCRILEKPPTGQPETLVEAMINVAIHGLYAQIIAEGLQRNEWQEPQLAAFQEQLKSINLPVFVTRGLEMEPAGQTHTLETIPSWKLAQWFSVVTPNPKKTSLWQYLADGKWVLPLKMWLVPRGWIYQNMAVIGSFRWPDAFDPENETILPAKTDENARTFRKTTSRPLSPYNFLADIAVPNFSKAWQTTAYNQTIVNEAQIACALERYHLANGQYPDTLDALVPQFMETLPHDIIGGQPLRYRRTDDGKFILYSIGWNETDDGGQQKSHRGYPYTDDYSKGDWVWPVTAK